MLSAIIKRAVFYQGYKVKIGSVALTPKRKKLNMIKYPRNARVKFGMYNDKQSTTS